MKVSRVVTLIDGINQHRAKYNPIKVLVDLEDLKYVTNNHNNIAKNKSKLIKNMKKIDTKVVFNFGNKFKFIQIIKKVDEKTVIILRIFIFNLDVDLALKLTFMTLTIDLDLEKLCTMCITSKSIRTV